MKRTHEYCDACGKEVSYLDGDLDPHIHGIRLECSEDKRRLPMRLRATANVRTSVGHSSAMRPLDMDVVCGPDCLERAFTKWLAEVREAFR